MHYLKHTTYILMGATLLFLFHFHLMAALIGGLTVFLIVNQLHDFIGTKVHSKWAHKTTVLAVTVVTVSILSLIGAAIYSGITAAINTNLSDDFFQQLRNILPPSLSQYVPNDMLVLKDQAIVFLKTHLPNLFSITTHSAHSLFIVIFGMLIGAVVAFSFLKDKDAETAEELEAEESKLGPLTKELMARITLFASVFQKVAFAQVKISGINTVLTAIYLLAILPMLGINIPYAKTLVLLTFVLGLLPVIGNAISNTLITVLSLMVSIKVAVASLVFLVVIHKLEYYVNAKIVGGELRVSIWEMLIVILVFQAVFGIIGAVLSPVIYGYLKEELKNNKLI